MILKNKLSILICSIERRKQKLQTLLNFLENQIIKTKYENYVEILVELDDEKKSIGEKRNNLLSKSSGDYIVFIDDDDLVSTNYIEKIVNSIQENSDCIGFKGRIEQNGEMCLFTNSLKIKNKYSLNKQYFSHICHINPIKASIAKQYRFLDKFFGEDKSWLKKILDSELLKTETFIDEEMYFYSPSGEDSLKSWKDRTYANR